MRLPTSAPHARASASGERGGDRLHALHSHIKAPLCATDQVQHSVLASCQHCRQRRQVCAHAKRGGDNDASSDEGDFDDDYYASTGGIFGNIFRSPRNRTGKSKRGHEEKLRADGELFDEEEYHREEPEPNDHKKLMLKYVNECDVSVVDSFMKKAPRDVREAVQHTAGSTTGSLPWAYFEVNVVTIGENLKSLMHSVIMSGYVMRIVVDELDMQFGVEQAMPDAVDNSESTQPARAGHRPWDDGFAPNAQCEGVTGTVKRWHFEDGVQETEAAEYIADLERKLEACRERIEERESHSRHMNSVMEFMHKHGYLDSGNVSPGKEVSEAMEAFMTRLLGTADASELRNWVAESTARELHVVIVWLMVVGYTLRSMEIKYDLEQSFALPQVSMVKEHDRL